MIGPGGLAVEAPGGQAEGGVRRRRHGGEEEAVRQLRTRSAEEPALEAAVRAGERASFLLIGSLTRAAACCPAAVGLLNTVGKHTLLNPDDDSAGFCLKWFHICLFGLRRFHQRFPEYFSSDKMCQ